MSVDIQAIKDSNPLDQVVERFTGQQIEKHKISCPLHSDTTPSMHIYDDGGFKCFSCGIHGDVLDFVGYFFFGQQYDSATHFTDIIDRLGGINIAPLPERTVKPKPEPTKLSIDLASIMDWHLNMPDSRRAYWLKRGLFDQTINDFMLGWDGKRYTIPHLYRLVPFGVKRRVSQEEMSAATQRNEEQTRQIKADNPTITDQALKKMLPALPEKYTSVTGSRSGLFNADVLWNTDKVVICEGEIDAMLLTQWGFPAVSSTAGAGTFKEKWVDLFSGVSKIWLMYDNDEAGRKGEALVKSILRRAKIVRYPQGTNDCGDLFEKSTYPVNWLYENLV